MAEALTGAPVHAKETVLKILERLTQRLDRAERDRDVAIGRYRELQARSEQAECAQCSEKRPSPKIVTISRLFVDTFIGRFEQLEDELAKKRGELRELLRQDGRIYHNQASSGRSEAADPGPCTEPVNGRYGETNGAAEAGAKAKGGLSVIVEAGDTKAEADTDRLSERSASSTMSKPEAAAKLEARSPEKLVEETASPKAGNSLPGEESTASATLDEAERSTFAELKLNPKLKVGKHILCFVSYMICNLIVCDLYFDQLFRINVSNQFKIFCYSRSRIIFKRG